MVVGVIRGMVPQFLRDTQGSLPLPGQRNSGGTLLEGGSTTPTGDDTKRRPNEGTSSYARIAAAYIIPRRDY